MDTLTELDNYIKETSSHANRLHKISDRDEYKKYLRENVGQAHEFMLKHLILLKRIRKELRNK